MAKQKVLFISLFLSFIISFSQTRPPYQWDTQYLDANDMKVSFNSGGDMSWDLFGEPGFEVPKGSGKHCIFAGSPWIGGIDNTSQLRVAGQTYRQSGHDFWPGPTGNNLDSAYFARYTRIWKVNKTEIDNHRLNFGQVGYVMPTDIAEWPAHGDVSNGEPAFLAPYVDANLNGTYDPTNGDYPNVPGDQALYMIYSDFHFPNTEVPGERVMVDIHTIAYVFEAGSRDPLNQTLFLNHRIVNRSGINYNEFMLAQWADVEIGFFQDDYVGCDTLINAFFAYNGDDFDDTPSGYGYQPPAVGYVFLNQKMDYFRSYDNDFTSSGNPTLATHYYGYMKNYWPDGSPLTLGGNGKNGTISTNYMYSGNPLDSTTWSEVSAFSFPNDRRALGSTGPHTLPNGGEICLDLAIVFARADTGNNLSSVVMLKDRIQQIQAFYDSSQLSCPQAPNVSIDDELSSSPTFQLYPNPTKSELFLSLQERQAHIEIFDMQGKVLLKDDVRGVLERKWDIGDWARGMYLVKIQTPGGSWTRKIVKE